MNFEDARVDISAFNFQTDQWDVVATATVSPEDKPYAMEYSNMTWHVWKAEAVLGAPYWKAGAKGHKASVMASAGTIPFMTGEDLVDCFSAYKDEGPESVYSNCRAPYSPAARIQTIDYEPSSSEPSVQLTGSSDWGPRDGDLPPFPQPCSIELDPACWGVVLVCYYTSRCVNPAFDDDWWEVCGPCVGVGDIAFGWVID